MITKNYTWSFRYTNPDGASTVTEEGVGNSFLIESNNYDGKIIAPEKAAWIKMQNGCIVLTDEKSEFNNAKTGGDGALIFNVENIENDEMATDTEDITTSAVTVIAGNGDIIQSRVLLIRLLLSATFLVRQLLAQFFLLTKQLSLLLQVS